MEMTTIRREELNNPLAVAAAAVEPGGIVAWAMYPDDVRPELDLETIDLMRSKNSTFMFIRNTHGDEPLSGEQLVEQARAFADQYAVSILVL